MIMATPENGRTSDAINKGVGGDEIRSKSRKINSVRWTVGLVVRLCIWYAVLAPFFRCPSHLSELNETSARVCKPYLIVRSYIEPHVLPYYNTYGAPYVEIARPYVQVVNDNIYTPAANVAKHGFDQYGAPALDQAQSFGQQKWEAWVVPRLQAEKEKTVELYNSQVAPHVKRVEAILSPPYRKSRAALITVYGEYILPFYARTRPFIGKTYASGQNILATTVLPYAQRTWSSVIYFANSSLWPKITSLYSKNVEPQLVKIGQRLASHREGDRLRKVMSDVDSSSDQPAPPTSASAETSQISEPMSTTYSTTEVSSVQNILSPTEQAAQAREKIESDLQTWQSNFAIIADKGAKDLEERVKEIVESYITGGAKSHGESLITALETTVKDDISTAKLRISALVESLPTEDAPQEEEMAQGEVLKAIRQAATSIRDHAHALREWHNSFDQKLERQISTAVSSTLDVIGSVRDLGLQEIGMRWAWMDSVTYEDWAKYHALKAQSDDWKSKFNRVEMQHTELEEAKMLANDILGRGMDVAEDAAKELARLKDVGKWKIAAREADDNFDTRTDPPPPRPKPSNTFEESADADAVPIDTPLDSVSLEAATTSISDQTIFSNTEAMDDDPLLPDNEDSSLTGDNQSVLNTPNEADEVTNDSTRKSWGVAAAEIVSKQDIPDDDEFSEDPRSLTSSIAAELTPLAYISSVASSKLSEGLSLASAQLAEAQATAVSTTGLEYNRIALDAQRRYYEAIGIAHDRYSVFISFASETVYSFPTPTGNLERVASQASENWESLVASASEEVYGTQIPHTPEASSYMIPQYEAMEKLVSELLVGKEPSVAENIMSKLQAIYETPSPTSALSLASIFAIGDHATASSASGVFVTNTPIIENILEDTSEQLQSAINAVSDHLYGKPKGPYEQATSAASPHIREALYADEPDYMEAAKEVIGDAHSSAESAISSDVFRSTSPAESEQEEFESATSNLGAATESAQEELTSLASSTSSSVLEVVETTISPVEVLMNADDDFVRDEF